MTIRVNDGANDPLLPLRARAGAWTRLIERLLKAAREAERS